MNLTAGFVGVLRSYGKVFFDCLLKSLRRDFFGVD